jgi:hypothetical protein
MYFCIPASNGTPAFKSLILEWYMKRILVNLTIREETVAGVHILSRKIEVTSITYVSEQ